MVKDHNNTKLKKVDMSFMHLDCVRYYFHWIHILARTIWWKRGGSPSSYTDFK